MFRQQGGQLRQNPDEGKIQNTLDAEGFPAVSFLVRRAALLSPPSAEASFREGNQVIQQFEAIF